MPANGNKSARSGLFCEPDSNVSILSLTVLSTGPRNKKMSSFQFHYHSSSPFYFPTVYSNMVELEKVIVC